MNGTVNTFAVGPNKPPECNADQIVCCIFSRTDFTAAPEDPYNGIIIIRIFVYDKRIP